MTLEEIKVRYDGIQSRLKYIHEYGCLFLCLCEIIEEVTNAPCDIIRVVQESKARGWLEEDYTVSNSLAILNTFTKKEWKRTTQGMIHSFIHCIHGDITLGAEDKAVNKRGRVPALT